MIGASNMIETENPQKKIPKYYWKGKYRNTPEDFILFSDKIQGRDCMNVLWQKWFFGDKDKCICPYRFFNPREDLPVKTDYKLFSKLKKVIEKLITIAIEQKYVSNIIE